MNWKRETRRKIGIKPTFESRYRGIVNDIRSRKKKK